MNAPAPSSPIAISPSEGTWRHDFLASVVVFLVALPLCMGIAIASGVPAEKAAAIGIITGIVGGIVVGALAGSPLLITGPAALPYLENGPITTAEDWDRMVSAFGDSFGVFALWAN